MLTLPPRAPSLVVAALALVGTPGNLGVPQGPAEGSARAPEDETAPEAQELFLTHCASCHGREGDGDGWTTLDRPARSFRDGGFSFGNTPEALFRTISTGIPGTPMPGFDTALGEPQRRRLAAFVRTLGPAPEEAPTHGSTLEVGERALVVRGCLPPIDEGLPVRPRGLLLGTPEGFTFEYRRDDLRLLGVRQGGFVERTDWSGRGGTPLEPLGRVVWLVERGDPAPTFATADAPLRARPTATWARGAAAGIEYRLLAGDEPGVAVAEVHETPRVVRASFGTGFARRFEVAALRPLELRVRAAAPVAPERVRAAGTTDAGGDPALPTALHWAIDTDDGGVLWACVRAAGGAPAPRAVADAAPGDPRVGLTLEGGQRTTLEIVSFVLPAWDGELSARVLAELVR